MISRVKCCTILIYRTSDKMAGGKEVLPWIGIFCVLITISIY